MRSPLRKLLGNEFVRNVLTLLTGNTISQAIGLLSIPILTRLYSPEEFGAVALFISILSVCTVASTARYDSAIVIPRRNGHAFHLMAGSIMLVTAFSLVILIVIAAFHGQIAPLFGHTSFRGIIWLLPLLVFLMGSHKSIQLWFNRNRYFKSIAINSVAQTSSQTALRLCRPLYTNGYWGLIVGLLVGEVIAWGLYVRKLLQTDYWRAKHLSLATTFRVFREYSNFPAYLLPMGIINTFSTNILVFSLSAIASSATVGLYERAWRVITLPLTLISSSFASVFYERMTRTQNPKRLFLASYFINLGLATALLFPVFIWGEAIFGFVLGPDWEVAGRMARVILPLTLFNYATACISNVFSVYSKNQVLLVWQIIYLILVVTWIFMARNLDIFTIIQIYAFIGATLYAILAIIGFYIVCSFTRSQPKN